jgi:hypothetical protein
MPGGCSGPRVSIDPAATRCVAEHRLPSREEAGHTPIVDPTMMALLIGLVGLCVPIVLWVVDRKVNRHRWAIGGVGVLAYVVVAGLLLHVDAPDMPETLAPPTTSTLPDAAEEAGPPSETGTFESVVTPASGGEGATSAASTTPLPDQAYPNGTNSCPDGGITSPDGVGGMSCPTGPVVELGASYLPGRGGVCPVGWAPDAAGGCYPDEHSLGSI